MRFRELLGRLRLEVKTRIQNGELTERGLARRLGISQSHIHNVLSGSRTLTADTADQLLAGLQLSVLDLLEELRLTGALPAEGIRRKLPRRENGPPPAGRVRGKRGQPRAASR